MKNKRIVILSGAGISAESGIKTFRDSNGLWEEHRIEDVASPQGWASNPNLVLEFYNLRRRNVRESLPNEAHYALTELQQKFHVDIITQNVDDLHERAGSKNILHLHGEILKSRSTKNPNLIYTVKEDIILGDLCELGSQLRPHIVWFGEAVPNIDKAIDLISVADEVAVIGTSLSVYPAAGLIHYARKGANIVVINPNANKIDLNSSIQIINEKATTGVIKWIKHLTK